MISREESTRERAQNVASLRHALERQADAIDAVLAHYKIAGCVTGGAVTPRFVRFDLQLHPGVRIHKVTTLSEEFALALKCASVRVHRAQGSIAIDVPRLDQQPVRAVSLFQQLDRVPALTALLGVDEDGAPLLLRVAASDVVHVLVAGTTGSGKTALVRTLLASLAHYNTPDTCQLLLIDPKRRGFEQMLSLPHVRGELADSSSLAQALLQQLCGEMERRDRERISQPALLLAIDELADLISTGGKLVEQMLVRLAQRGREAGIHLVACTQKPTAALISSALTANFPVRLVGAVASRDEARYATGISDSGAEKLRGKGDFLLISKAAPIRFQAAWISAEEINSIGNKEGSKQEE